MKVHPSAELFPLMSDAELRALATDIEANGLLQPIVICEGMILDGRNRLAACKKARVEPRFQEWRGECGSPTAYVLSQNLTRRHLTKQQLAIVAAKVKQRYAEELNPGRPEKGAIFGTFSGKARDLAAADVGVSHTYVDAAVAVLERDPELAEAVFRGEVKLKDASEQVGGRRVRGDGGGHSERPTRARTGKRVDVMEPYVPVTERQQAHARAAALKVTMGLSEINGICRALASVDYGMAAAGLNGDHDIWIRKAGELAKALRGVQSRLEEVCK